MAEKPSDKFCTPLCQSCHLDGPEAQHRGSEAAFWQRAGIDPFEVAARLWRTFDRRAARPPAVKKKLRERMVRIKRAGAKIQGRPFAKTAKKPWPKRSFK